MTENHFHAKSNLVRPGKIGKTVRMIMAIAMTAWVIRMLFTYENMTSMVFPAGLRWIGIFIMFYFLSDLFKIGFHRRWRRWPQISFLVVVAIGILINFLQTGSFWGPTVGWPIFIMTVVVAGSLAISFFLSTILGTPG